MNKLIKFFNLSLAIFILLIPMTKPVFSQTPTIASSSSSTSLDTLLQSSNCGELNQKCCNITNLNMPDISVNLSSPFSVLNDPINNAVKFLSDTLVKPTLNKIKNLLYNTLEINQQAYCKDGTQPSDLNNPASCTCISEALANASRLCLGITTSEKSECLSCVTSQEGIWTAIGCVQSDLGTFISQKLLGWGVGLAGIIAMLCIIYSAFQLQTSRGNPEKIKKAQELLTSCIMGLMLIIFSVFILRLIGVDILKIPGFK